jgi:hypothetical protein
VVGQGPPHARAGGSRRVVVVGVSVGEGEGRGTPVAAGACGGGVWWTGGHPLRGWAVGVVVVGVCALVGAGVLLLLSYDY